MTKVLAMHMEIKFEGKSKHLQAKLWECSAGPAHQPLTTPTFSLSGVCPM